MKKKIVALYLSPDGIQQLQALAKAYGIENPRRPGMPSASAMADYLIALIREHGAQQVKEALSDLTKLEERRG